RPYLCINKGGKMGTKKTIAIIGLTTGQENSLLRKLALNNRLLIVSDRTDNFPELSEFIQENTGEDAIELIDCAKDGCWEADIVSLWNGCKQQTKQLENLQAGATQEIVVFLTGTEERNSKHHLLPHSKIISVFITPDTNEVTIRGDNLE